MIDFALSNETLRQIEEQRAWIARESANPQPFKNLAQLYRIEGRQEEALGLLLEAVRLDNNFVEAHVELAQIYAIRGDARAAWRHARVAERNGDRRAVELLGRHGVNE